MNRQRLKRRSKNFAAFIWRPIYGFVRRQGVRPEEAKDLTQGFFALLLERRDLDAVRKEKGRLRSYLLTSLKHFLTNERNRDMAIKRGEGQRLIPLEDFRERESAGFESTDTSSCRANLRAPLGVGSSGPSACSVGRRISCRWSESAGLFDQLQKSLTDESDRPSQAEIAA